MAEAQSLEGSPRAMTSVTAQLVTSWEEGSCRLRGGWGVGGSRMSSEAATQAGRSVGIWSPRKSREGPTWGRLEDRKHAVSHPACTSPSSHVPANSLPFMFSLPMFNPSRSLCLIHVMPTCPALPSSVPATLAPGVIISPLDHFLGFPASMLSILESVLHTAARNSIFSFYKSNTET